MLIDLTKSVSNIQELSKLQKLVLFLLFVLFTVVGLAIAGDYGVPWDDALQTDVGKQNYELAIGKNNDIMKNNDRFYGSAFELPVYYAQHFFDSYSTQIYARHIITHFFFIFALFVFFKLLLKLFKSYWLSILGILFLYLSPRIFAHSFFNTKDIPFMSAFIISIYTMLRAVDKPSDIKLYQFDIKTPDIIQNIFFFYKTRKVKHSLSYGSLFRRSKREKDKEFIGWFSVNLVLILLHAFISAFLIDIRIIGFLIPVLTTLFFIMPKFQAKQTESILKPIVIYFVALSVFIMALWPVLWHEPTIIFKSIIRMSHFPWRYTNLFFGEIIKATEIPWYYIPTWIGISTPLLVLILYFIGSFSIVKDQFNSAVDDSGFHKLKLLILVMLPIDLWLLFIILGSTFYDGWRHLFFFYPLIIIGALCGLQAIINAFENNKGKIAILFIVGVLLLMPLIKIINLHPYQQVYFNVLVNKNDNSVRSNWEMDYWGLSYKEAFEKIHKIDERAEINIKVLNEPGILNARLLDNNINLVDSISDADYFISNYRFHPYEYKYIKVDSIQRQGSSILGIYKLSE